VSEEDVAKFEWGEDVRIIADEDRFGKPYIAVAMEYNQERGDWDEYPLEELPVGDYEVIIEDWDRGRFVYNLRFNGEIDGHDYIRVFGVEEDDLRKAQARRGR
jgi:hypothetical protein